MRSLLRETFGTVTNWSLVKPHCVRVVVGNLVIEVCHLQGEAVWLHWANAKMSKSQLTPSMVARALPFPSWLPLEPWEM